MSAGEGLSWVLEKPGSDSEQPRSLYNETGARRRRTHNKSRKGCDACKRRRVKCDEARPICGQCAEKNWSCELSDREAPAPQKKAKASRAPPEERYPSTPPTSVSDGLSSPPGDSRDWLHNQVLSILERLNVPSRQSGDSVAYQRQDAVELVDHFIDWPHLWIGSDVSQGVVRKHGFEMALDAEYLLHAILACSATHLSNLHPEVKKYDTAATLHYTRSLQAYSSQLVFDLERGNGNAMLCASGLLAKLTYINTPILYANEPLTGQTGPISWVRSMQGVKTLLSTPRLRTQLDSGFMFPIMAKYLGPVPVPSANPEDTPPGAHIIATLKDMCSLDGHQPQLANPYAVAIARLEPLMLIEMGNDNVDQMMSFVATLESVFTERLERNETRALLILSLWCARLSLIPQWWTRPAAVIECRRIAEHLSGEMDPRVRMLLQAAARILETRGTMAATLASHQQLQPAEGMVP
ncbi:hypothetical protein LTR53_012356 [Teratosphaeriaceae sp. CCFEE 6253]|nr:hypothetical protein LTR53_012356 [Teratosphaeriaceae sp. CCFEE 6253]